MGNKDLAWKEYDTLKDLDEQLANDLLQLLRNHNDAPKPTFNVTGLQTR
jgi:hypothetical protein